MEEWATGSALKGGAMIVACFLISIFTGLVAASYTLSGGSGLIAATLAYSLCGALALMLSMGVATVLARARESPSGPDMPQR